MAKPNLMVAAEFPDIAPVVERIFRHISGKRIELIQAMCGKLHTEPLRSAGHAS